MTADAGEDDDGLIDGLDCDACDWRGWDEPDDPLPADTHDTCPRCGEPYPSHVTKAVATASTTAAEMLPGTDEPLPRLPFWLGPPRW